MKLNDIKDLILFCRANNVSHFKVDDIEVKFRDFEKEELDEIKKKADKQLEEIRKLDKFADDGFEFFNKLPGEK